ncbi:4a-hydroxytetrahydrobiopterin dehydratase [Flavobacterium sp.]|uniref:4a-hydroxytetrahydrobiopterin dehydratase n=1 Tax=Flavobacterium sp. TaxID=239 RepID=UPI001B42DCB3|nr:4a-hydroxytetrahydrobiopterin dehydratase [Flavobacterium sp.]MBP6182959.1 4a-hydroxytetrahydrobiopterin dehydratase [Flavobacterium sp.]
MSWSINNNKLEKEFAMNSFSEIIEKLKEVCIIADSLNHHPDFLVYNYKKIKFSLSTHDNGNKVTEKDYELAEKLDLIF